MGTQEEASQVIGSGILQLQSWSGRRSYNHGTLEYYKARNRIHTIERNISLPTRQAIANTFMKQEHSITEGYVLLPFHSTVLTSMNKE